MSDMLADDIKKRAKHREDMFLRRLFGILAKMAKADRKVDAWESHAAEKAFEHFPRAAARRQFCVRVFNEAKDGRIPLYKMALEFANKWATPEDCLIVYGLLWDIACATGVLRPIHKQNLEGICKFLNLPDSYFGIYYHKRQGTFREVSEESEYERDEARRKAESEWADEWLRAEGHRKARKAQEEFFQGDYQRRMWEWFHRQASTEPPGRLRPRSPLAKEYELLGCACDATDAAVQSAYRAAAKRYHPDLLRANDHDEAFVRDATRKMALINAAWEKIRKERGL